MTDTIASGSILIAGNTLLPPSVRLKRKAYASNWRAVAGQSGRTGHRIAESGWSFLFIAETITVLVFGFNRQKTLRRAVANILATVTAQNFNAVELTHVDVKRFWGVSWVRVSAHARQVQNWGLSQGEKMVR